MDLGKKKFSGSREVSKKGPPLGLVIALAAAGGVVLGSAGTYFLFKPPAAPQQSVSPAAVGIPPATPPATSIAMPPKQQFTPAPQPPGEAPPGKVWSVEHGHWHDAPVTRTIPATTTPGAVTLTPATTPAPAPATAAPAGTTTPAPAEAPPPKKE